VHKVRLYYNSLIRVYMDREVQCIKCGRFAFVNPRIASVTGERSIRSCFNVDIWICIEHVEEWK